MNAKAERSSAVAPVVWDVAKAQEREKYASFIERVIHQPPLDNAELLLYNVISDLAKQIRAGNADGP